MVLLLYVRFIFCAIIPRQANASYLEASDPYPPLEAQKKGIQKHQLIWSLDFEIWQELVETFNIKESTIPHRNDEEFQRQNQHGWYS